METFTRLPRTGPVYLDDLGIIGAPFEVQMCRNAAVSEFWNVWQARSGQVKRTTLYYIGEAHKMSYRSLLTIIFTIRSRIVRIPTAK